MFQLFKQVHLDHISNLNDTHDRIIVSKDVSDAYIGAPGDTLSAELGIKGVATTRHFTADIKEFVNNTFVELLPELLASNRPVTIFCDDEAYIRLFTLWITHVYPTTSLQDIQELHFLLVLARETSEPFFDARDKESDPGYIRKVYMDTKQQPELLEQIKTHPAHFSLEYHLTAILGGAEAHPSVVPDIKRRLQEGLMENIGALRNRMRSLFFSPQMKLMFGEDTPDTEKRDTLSHFSALKVVNKPVPEGGFFRDKETLTQFEADYRHDLRIFLDTIAGTSNVDACIQDAMLPVELLMEEDDDRLISRYLDGFTQVDRFGVLIPQYRMRVFTVNLLFIALRRNTNQEPPLMPAWTA